MTKPQLLTTIVCKHKKSQLLQTINIFQIMWKTRAPRYGGGGYQNKLWAPLILQGCIS